ncbi:hypothetical protein V3C99_009777, partial [Haemonchus contortus]
SLNIRMRIFLVVLFTLLTVAFALDDVCKLDLEVGPCRAAFRRFGYSTTENKCIMFIYGGCRGNDNNFETEEECKQKCSRTNQEEGVYS